MLYSQNIHNAFQYIQDNDLEFLFVNTITHPYKAVGLELKSIKPYLEVDFVLDCTNPEIIDLELDSVYDSNKHVAPGLVQHIVANTLDLDRTKQNLPSGRNRVTFGDSVLISETNVPNASVFPGRDNGTQFPGGGTIPDQLYRGFGDTSYRTNDIYGGGGGDSPSDDDFGINHHPHYGHDRNTNNGRYDNGVQVGRCSYADRHRFHEFILKKDKLRSTEPLQVMNHLRRFRRWMLHSPPFLDLTIMINIFFDTLLGPPRALCEKYLVS